MQIIVQEARTVRGDPNSLILSLDINGIKSPGRLKELFNALKVMKGRQVTPHVLLSLLFALDG